MVVVRSIPRPAGSWAQGREICAMLFSGGGWGGGGLLPGEVQEDLLGSGFFRGVAGGALDVGAVGLHVPGAAAIVEQDWEDVRESRGEGTLRAGGDGFDAGGEVAVHPVGRADKKVSVQIVFGAISEVEDPRMFEEASDDR